MVLNKNMWGGLKFSLVSQSLDKDVPPRVFECFSWDAGCCQKATACWPNSSIIRSRRNCTEIQITFKVRGFCLNRHKHRMISIGSGAWKAFSNSTPRIIDSTHNMKIIHYHSYAWHSDLNTRYLKLIQRRQNQVVSRGKYHVVFELFVPR